jgi:hypothetical protein
MLDSAESNVRAVLPGMARKNTTATDTSKREKLPGQGDRLRRLRLALGYETSTAFAASLNIDFKRWNAFENDFPLSREVVFLLVRKFGVSSDWLYFGNPVALPLELARRLGETDLKGTTP